MNPGKIGCFLKKIKKQTRKRLRDKALAGVLIVTRKPAKGDRLTAIFPPKMTFPKSRYFDDLHRADTLQDEVG